MKGNFQIIILVIFVAAAVFGLLVFSGTIPLGNKTDTAGSLGTVTLWGTAKADALAAPIDDFNRANPTFVVKYVQKDPETFDQDLLEAMASGVGPDMFFLPDNLVFDYANKIYVIPYESYSAASFQNTFSSAGEVFMFSKGILAFPITVDPLMMYYNRSMLESNGIIYPPATWDDVVSYTASLTKKDELNKITKSTVALGQFSNVAHAKDILSALFMQAGNQIITEKDGSFSSVLGESGASQISLDTMLSFFTSFSDPLKNVYSWNRSFANSRDTFSSDNLAFYFGYASELQTLVNKNPNLNFAVAPFPQIKNTNFKLTSGKVTGIAVSNFSKNLSTALTAASLLATSDFASKYAEITQTPPARKDLLSKKMTDAYNPYFYSSALYARSWLDPSTNDTDNIFKNMIEGTLSNNFTAQDAIRDAGAKINLLLMKYR
ncbi:MAG TPA: extracellular solute-binding protein [Candidatus Paceibacterota bacterium]|nr:extracellular solute-binding protein [Candidatus Paceibacterota bacterium]